MQRDAIERLDLTRLLLEPEMLEAVEPDVHLVGTLLSLNRVMPEHDQGRRRGRWSARSSTSSSSGSPTRTRAGGDRRAQPGGPHQPARSRATSTGTAPSAANLKHYQPEHRTIVPERLVGYGRRDARPSSATSSSAIDQSGSMAASVVYAVGLRRGARLACGRCARSLVVFDTAVVDLTDELRRPGRRAVRHAARRRHRHQPRARLLPGPHHPAARTRSSC